MHNTLPRLPRRINFFGIIVVGGGFAFLLWIIIGLFILLCSKIEHSHNN